MKKDKKCRSFAKLNGSRLALPRRPRDEEEDEEEDDDDDDDDEAASVPSSATFWAGRELHGQRHPDAAGVSGVSGESAPPTAAAPPPTAAAAAAAADAGPFIDCTSVCVSGAPSADGRVPTSDASVRRTPRASKATYRVNTPPTNNDGHDNDNDDDNNNDDDDNEISRTNVC